MDGPRLINSGKAAVEAIAKVLPKAHSITVQSSLGPVELKPGTIWSGNRMLVYPQTMSVVYAIDDRLYESGTGNFIRDETVDAAFREAPKVIRLIQDLRKRSPTLFGKMMSTAAKEVLTNLPAGVAAEDVAFFVGRVIKGAAAAGPELTFGALIKIAATVAGLVTATHLPNIAAHTVAHVAGQKAAELMRALTQAGYTVTEAEARTVLKELLAKPDTPAMLRQLELACKALVPSLNQLKNAYKVAH